MDVLVVSHCPFSHAYGATNSLRLHLLAFKESNSCIKFSLACPGRVCASLLIKYGIQASYQARMPWAFVWDGSIRDPIRFRSAARSFSNAINFILFGYFLLRIRLLRQRFALVHLNSVVLVHCAPLIKLVLGKHVSVLMHVRERVVCAGLFCGFSLGSVDKIIFIDSAVRQYFQQFFPASCYAGMIVNNLVEPPVPQVSLLAEKHLSAFSNRFIFSMIGAISDHDKGCSFVVDAFDRSGLSSKGAVLLLIGCMSDSRICHLKESNSLPEGVFVLGELDCFSDSGAYHLIDVVVRGESKFNPGRTIYEALSYGKRSLIPGAQTDLDGDDLLSKFSCLTKCYRPRDTASLSAAMRDLFNNADNAIQASVVPLHRLYDSQSYRSRVEELYLG